MEFTGDFETHITVGLCEAGDLKALQQWSVIHGLKCLHIVLDRGHTVSQPMLTRRGRGGLSRELGTASKLSETLNAEGFQVTRIKIEAAPWNQDIPQSSIEAAQHPPDRYFEHHIKLLLDPSADISTLGCLAESHAAHLSRNALRLRDDDRQERFITQRCRLVGYPEARERLNTLLQAIAPFEHPVLKVEEEFVVYDSNLALDTGWLSSEE